MHIFRFLQYAEFPSKQKVSFSKATGTDRRAAVFQ